MLFFVISFLAGVLTVAAPCVLPLLPVIVGGSVLESEKEKRSSNWVRPVIIALSLAVSVILFTLLIKASTALLGVPQVVWQVISGLIVALLGVQYIWPHAWEVISKRSGLFTRSNKILGSAYKNKSFVGTVLVGAALGPVFSSCSPTYALIVAGILPVSFFEGFLYLLAYAFGMSGTLLLIAFLGQVFISKLRWLSNPSGTFKKIVGLLFIVVGIFVLFGFDKKLQAYVLEKGWYDPISGLEERLRK